MDEIDYIHEIALSARHVADSYEADAFESLGDTDKETDAKRRIKEAADSEAAFSAFEDTVPCGLGMAFGIESKEHAMALSELVFHSFYGLGGEVSARSPKDGLRIAAYEAVRRDIKHCVFSEMRTRVKNHKRENGMMP